MGDEPIIDLSNYRKPRRIYGPGTYRVQVEDTEPTESTSGYPMLNVWFTILGGEFAGQTITDRLTFVDVGMSRVESFIRAVGLPAPISMHELDLRGLVGRQLDIDVGDGESYSGRIRPEVRGYRKVAAAP